jgi:kumamolisin
MGTRIRRPAWLCTVGATLGLAVAAAAQEPTTHPDWATALSSRGTLIIPASSHKQPVPAGHRFKAHTNVRFFVPDGVNPNEAPPIFGLFYETPASLACHYGLAAEAPGASPNCNPGVTATNVTGGSWRIALIDAYTDPSASADLAGFAAQFGLPLAAGQLTIVQATTAAASCSSVGPDPTGGGWEVESTLDIEMAHAMAPNATLFLVQACSSDETDLQQAILVANNLVKCKNAEINPTTHVLGTCPASSIGKGEVSMSWGGGEYPSETGADNCAGLDDSCFTAPGIVYFAAAGDSPGVEYPSVSPNVVGVGGTSLRRNATTGDYEAEAPWVDTGGGISVYEGLPAYQTSIGGLLEFARGVPDVAFDADPYTGVWVYFDGSWGVVGGTSVAAPAVAGIVNKASGFAVSSAAELEIMYAAASGFRDIKSGFCGLYMGFSGTAGWDFCTGLGAVYTYAGK